MENRRDRATRLMRKMGHCSLGELVSAMCVLAVWALSGLCNYYDLTELRKRQVQA